MYCNTISESKLNTYKQCKLKYKFRYVDRLVDPEGANTEALEFGKYIHKVLEEGYQAKTEKELQEIARRVKPGFTISKKYEGKDFTCIRNFFKFNQGLGKTVGTELVYEVPLEEGSSDMSVNGVIDRIIEGDKGGYLIIDYKTSKREKSRVELFQDTQLKGYAFAISKLYKVPVQDIVVAHYYPLTNNFVYLSYTSNQIASYARMIKEQIWKIRKEKSDTMKASRNEFCNWCSFKVLCPEFNNPRECVKRLDEEKARTKEIRAQRKGKKK